LSAIEQGKPDVVLHGAQDNYAQGDLVTMTLWENVVSGVPSCPSAETLQRLTSTFDHVFARTEEARQSLLAATTGTHDKVSVLPAQGESPPSDHVANIIHKVTEAKSRTVEPENKPKSKFSVTRLFDRLYWLLKRRPWIKERLKGWALARLLISKYHRSE
jgi:hypothetical protein